MPASAYTDRSRSPSRRKNSRDNYNDDASSYRTRDDEYSDSFYSDDDSSPETRKRGPAKGKKWRGGNNSKRNKGQSTPRGSGMDHVTKRMLSARRLKINELRNESEALVNELRELRTENKTLKRQHHMSNKVLDKYENQESEVPSIIQKHGEEVRSYKEQLRKQRDKFTRTNNKLKDTEDELEKTRRLLKKMKGLVDDRQLKERDDLTKKLSKMEEQHEDDEKKVKDLEKHRDYLQKNHRHEFGIERARHRETQRQLDEMVEKFEKMQTTLREREKEIEVRNIYSMRMMKPPHKLNSSMSSTPVPNRVRSRKNSDPSNMMTPREKMKMFEEKRREEEKRKRESRISEDPIPENAVAAIEDHSGRKDKSPTRAKPSTKAKRSPVKPVENHVYTQQQGHVYTPANNVQSPKKPKEKPTKSVPQSQSPNDATSSKNDNSDSFFLTQSHDREESEVSEPLFNLHTGKQNEPQGKSRQIDKSREVVREESIPLFDIKNPQKGVRGKDGSQNAANPMTLTSKPARSERIYRSYKDGKVEESAGYDPTWLSAQEEEAGYNPTSKPTKPKPVTSKPFNFTSHKKQGLSSNREAEQKQKEREEAERVQRMREEQEKRAREERLAREREREEREQKEREEKAWWERNQKEKKNEIKVEESNSDDEEKWRAEREAKKREAERIREQQERERKERERQEQEERRQREENERRQREQEEKDRIEREERESREIDRRAEEEGQRLANSEAEKERQRQKQILLLKMKAIDSQQGKGHGDSPESQKKDYNFKEATENMHRGKPAYGKVDVPVLKQNRKKSLFDDDDDDIGGGGYKPTFASNSTSKPKPAANNRKSDLMTDLFGDSVKTNNNSRKSSSKRNDRENSSTQLFGGGSALIDDDEPPPHSNAHLLPRRQRQPTTTISSRPTVNAVDTFDDDIEELTL